MICDVCRAAGKAAANDRPTSARLLHAMCMGCPCQHKTDRGLARK